MTKFAKIRVDHCGNCPEVVYKEFHMECGVTGQDIFTGPSINPIPEWCPLEDEFDAFQKVLNKAISRELRGRTHEKKS